MNVPSPVREQIAKPVAARLLDGNKIAINGRHYEYEPVEGGDGILAHVRLTYGDPFADDFEIYDVVRLSGWCECTCADFTYRSGQEGKECKHIAACRECGLLA